MHKHNILTIYSISIPPIGQVTTDGERYLPLTQFLHCNLKQNIAHNKANISKRMPATFCNRQIVITYIN